MEKRFRQRIFWRPLVFRNSILWESYIHYDRCILKRIRFKFRVDYDAETGGKVLFNENDVETVVLMEATRRQRYR